MGYVILLSYLWNIWLYKGDPIPNKKELQLTIIYRSLLQFRTMVLQNFDILWKNYHTIEKTMILWENTGTILKTMERFTKE